MEGSTFFTPDSKAPIFVTSISVVEIAVLVPADGATRRFKTDEPAKARLAKTAKLADLKADHFDAIFYAGGHGPLWDLSEDKTSIALIEAFWAAKKPVSAVCHAPGVLRHVIVDGAPLVKGRKVTGFSDSEEAAVNLTDIVPYLLEDELKRLGGLYKAGPDWDSFTQIDGNLITGQNPASSIAVANAVIGMLHAADEKQVKS